MDSELLAPFPKRDKYILHNIDGNIPRLHVSERKGRQRLMISGPNLLEREFIRVDKALEQSVVCTGRQPLWTLEKH